MVFYQKVPFNLVSGKGRGILDHVDFQDIVTFTGSAATGQVLRGLASFERALGAVQPRSG